MSELEWQYSSDLSKLVREHDKEGRVIEAATWRKARAIDPKMARKIWVAKKRASQRAIEDFWNTPTCSPNISFANFISNDDPR